MSATLERERVKREPVRVHGMHLSMQFSDTPKQMTSDAERLFGRASKRDVKWVTGTEAGGKSPLDDILREVAEEHDYRFWKPRASDVWFAVAQDFIDGGWDTHYEKVVDGVAKKYTDKGAAAVSWHNDTLGDFTLMAAHYLTKGRPSARDPYYRQFIEENRRLCRAIGDYAQEKGRGQAIVLYQGDQNIVDRTDDTFMGEPLTSAWDELKRWENTGHGNIDVAASYDLDGRVEAAYIRALDDSEFHLHTDHFLIEVGWDIKPPRLLAA